MSREFVVYDHSPDQNLSRCDTCGRKPFDHRFISDRAELHALAFVAQNMPDSGQVRINVKHGRIEVVVVD